MRNQKIDFFRGLALIIIFIDHIYYNRLGGYTLRGFGVTDAAEIFFFCSGFVSAIVYSKYLDRKSFSSIQFKAMQRSLYIYFFHITSFLLLIALTLPLIEIDGVLIVLKARGLHEIFYGNWTTGLTFFTLQYQPFLFTILPAYIVLSLMTPFFTLVLKRSSTLLFTLSFSIYLIAQYYPAFNLIQGPNNSPWIFNPFAYQFLFVIGMLFAKNTKTKRYIIPMRVDIFIIATLLLLFIFIFHNLIPSLYKHYHLFQAYQYSNGLPFTAKTNEEPLRIVHFMILMYVTIFLINLISFKAPSFYKHFKKLSRPIILCGQNSIFIFTLGILLSYFGGYIIASYGDTAIVWIPVNTVGITLMLYAGTWLTKKRTSGHSTT